MTDYGLALALGLFVAIFLLGEQIGYRFGFKAGAEDEKAHAEYFKNRRKS